MRTKWLLIALPLILFGVLAQSAFWVPTYASQAEHDPERLSTFLRADIGDVKHLNPILQTEAGGMEIMLENVTETLVDSDETGKLKPRLADRWQVTEEAYLAVLPGRKLPDGAPVTAQSLLSAVQRAWKSAQLGGVETSIQSVEIVPRETRTFSETVLVDSANGKKDSVSVDMTAPVPERIKFRLSKVETQLFKRLEPVVGASYFEKYPFAGDFQLKKPELLAQIRDKLPELLAIGEHNPVITFFIHPGVRWHDGAPLTAEDVKFTYEASIDPKNTSPRSSTFVAVRSVEVVNELTARITYKHLYSPAIIDWASMDLIPKHLLDDAALLREMNVRNIAPSVRKTFTLRNSTYNLKPIGSGPFKFSEWVPDQYIRLTRNDDYWGRKAEYKDLYFRVIPDYLTMELEFQSGALDRYEAQPYQAERYLKDPNYHVVSSPEGQYSYIGYNLRRPLFQDARVRRALGMAIDVDSIIKYVLYGQGRRSTGPYFWSTPFGDKTQTPLPYDPAGAAALLAEAGWKKNSNGLLEKDGKVFQFTLVTNNANQKRKAVMTIAQEAWRKLGIDCKIQVFEWTVFIDEFIDVGNFDAYVLGWVGGDLNPDQFQIWHSSQTHPYELNYVAYNNPRADDLIMRIRTEYDADKQIQLTRELHRLIAEDQPYTFLYEPLKPIVFDKRVVRVLKTPDGKELIKNIEAPAFGSVDLSIAEWRKLRTAPRGPVQ
jgi:ABC-type transport system substrate-binding protein